MRGPRTRTRFLVLSATVAVLLVAIALPATASKDQELPFSAVLTGDDVDFNMNPGDVAVRCEGVERAFSVTTFTGVGNATHLGRVVFVAQHCSQLDEFGNPGPYTRGELTITAANGDVLEATYTNGVSLTPPPLIEFTDDFTFVDGGTGRFAEASGGGVETGVFQFFTDAFEVNMEGVIYYDASNRRGD